MYGPYFSWLGMVRSTVDIHTQHRESKMRRCCSLALGDLMYMFVFGQPLAVPLSSRCPVLCPHPSSPKAPVLHLCLLSKSLLLFLHFLFLLFSLSEQSAVMECFTEASSGVFIACSPIHMTILRFYVSLFASCVFTWIQTCDLSASKKKQVILPHGLLFFFSIAMYCC